MAVDYPRFHRNRTNLLIHIVAVPLFVVCALWGLWSIASGNWLGAWVLLGLPLSLAAQGYGHKLEEYPPDPFRGPAHFLQRFLTEQFYRFWVFVVSGAWRAALSESKKRSA